LTNRREFIRSAIATTTVLAVGVTGMFEIAAKAGAGQSNTQQVLLPPVSTSTGQPPSGVQTQAATTTSQAQSEVTSQGSTATQPATAQSTSSSSSSAPPAGYFLVAQLSSLSGKSSAYFNHPSYGESILINLSGQWKAFNATCTHRPCTVDYQSSEIYCPCHGATFSASNGSVTRGPARTALGEYGVMVQGSDVYVSDAVIN
jgi:cytochrome b6-f complex iron-sulfur subunit